MYRRVWGATLWFEPHLLAIQNLPFTIFLFFPPVTLNPNLSHASVTVALYHVYMTSLSHQVYVLRMRKMNNDNRPKWTFSISSAENGTTQTMHSLAELGQFFGQMMAAEDADSTAAPKGDQ